MLKSFMILFLGAELSAASFEIVIDAISASFKAVGATVAAESITIVAQEEVFIDG